MDKIAQFLTNKNLYVSAIVVVLSMAFYILIKKVTNRILDKRGHLMNRKKKTYAKLLNNIFKYIMLIIVTVTVLQINGVNVTSIVAGLGLVSVIAGLALQDALKDIIMGFNLIVDDYFSVGDVVRITGVDGQTIEGKVMEIGLKATKLKDTLAGNILVIANRNISQALTVSTMVDIDIPLPYEEKKEKIEKIIEEMLPKISLVENISGVEYKGIQKFDKSAIIYKIRFQCKPELNFQATRDVNGIIKSELDKNKVEIPYTQISLHNVK